MFKRAEMLLHKLQGIIIIVLYLYCRITHACNECSMIFTHLMCTCITIGRAFNISSHPQYHAISKQQNMFVRVALGDYFYKQQWTVWHSYRVIVTCIEDIYYVLLYYIHSPNTVSHLYTFLVVAYKTPS